MGIDIVKILAMFLVVVSHVNACGLSVNLGGQSVAMTHSFVQGVAECSINMFALASGFVCVNCRWRLSRYVELYLQVLFWGVVGISCALALGCSLSPMDFLRVVLPVSLAEYWYFTAYSILFLMMPVLNAGLKSLDGRNYRLFLMALFALTSFMPFVLANDVFVLNKGYSYAWLSFVYCLGAYFKLHGLVRLRGWHFVLMGALAVVSALQPVVRELCKGVPFLWGLTFVSYVSPVTLLLSLLIFNGIVKVEVEDRLATACIQKLASLSFGVYLIHVQPVVFREVWRRGLSKIQVVTVGDLIFKVCALAALFFAALLVLEFVRSVCFEKIGVSSFVRRIVND